jgi:serine/threonine protein kinase
MDNDQQRNKNNPKEKNCKTLIGDYVIKHTIGKGTFGKVKIGLHTPTNEDIAIKILEKNKITDKDDMIRIEREMKISKSLNHLNIIKIFEVKIISLK